MEAKNLKVILTILVLSLVASLGQTYGEEILFEFKETAQKDIRLKFTLDKNEWDGTDLMIWGTVENVGSQTYKRVQVVITLEDTDGALIASQTWYAEPATIEPGGVGHLEEKRIECKGKVPHYFKSSVMAWFSRGRLPR